MEVINALLYKQSCFLGWTCKEAYAEIPKAVDI